MPVPLFFCMFSFLPYCSNPYGYLFHNCALATLNISTKNPFKDLTQILD